MAVTLPFTELNVILMLMFYISTGITLLRTWIWTS